MKCCTCEHRRDLGYISCATVVFETKYSPSPYTINSTFAMPLPDALDDSALGRFQNFNAMSVSGVDPNTVSYHIRSESSSSTPSDASEPAPETPGPSSQDEIGGNLHTVEPTHDLEDDMASTVSGMSDFASSHAEQEAMAAIEHLKISATGPELEYRYIKGSDTYGRAPFTKPHFISNSTEAPFSGPHTAIDTPFGADFGKYLHISHALRATELSEAKLAIFWLWSGLRKNEGTGKETTHYGPAISPALLARHKTGLPEAPYPMTESTFPAFVGPRICIVNTGFVLNGWILQIPRYFCEEETKVASVKLQEFTDKITPWSLGVDPSCKLEVKRTETEKADLKAFLGQQKKDTMLLKDVVGLYFAAQDDKEATVAPIWRRESTVDAALETPKKPVMLPTPPTNGEKKIQPQPVRSKTHDLHAESSSSQTLVVAKATTARADLARAARNPFRTAGHIRAWSRDVASFSAGVKFPEQVAHPRPATANEGDIEQDDSSLLRSSHRFPALADSGTQTDTVVPQTSKIRPAVPSPVYSEQKGHSNNRGMVTMAATLGGLYDLVSTVPICDLIIITFCSSLLCFLLLSEVSWLQDHIIWPSDMLSWLAEIPERRNAIVLFTLLVGPFVGLLLSAIPNLPRVLAGSLAGIVGLFVAAQVLSMF